MPAASPTPPACGLRRNVVQRSDGTEEQAYADNLGPGTGEEGFEGRNATRASV